jgi:ribosome-binding protein aMBF1 (putative translation factor)
MSLNLASLGTVIKNHRKYKDLTTQQLTDKLNVSAGFINNMENARNDVLLNF